MTLRTKLLTGLMTAQLFLVAAPCAAIVQAPKVGLVNFKTCVEKSKLGKQEQTNFDNMKKQMEGVLEEKEKSLTDISKKLNDPDYIDSLSSDAEAELRHKFRSLNQELAQHQQHFMQVLQQANFKVIQKISENISKASQTVAREKSLDLIMNEEGVFFFSPSLDVSDDVVKVMDSTFKPEEKK